MEIFFTIIWFLVVGGAILLPVFATSKINSQAKSKRTVVEFDKLTPEQQDAVLANKSGTILSRRQKAVLADIYRKYGNNVEIKNITYQKQSTPSRRLSQAEQDSLKEKIRTRKKEPDPYKTVNTSKKRESIDDCGIDNCDVEAKGVLPENCFNDGCDLDTSVKIGERRVLSTNIDLRQLVLADAILHRGGRAVRAYR